MPKLKYRGRTIEPQSYGSDGRWLPRALVMTDTRSGTSLKTVQAPLDKTFTSKEDADAYAMEMAKKWIDDHMTSG